MYLYGFSIRATMRTYSIDLRERNYPTFTGRYNAYVAVWGQLSEEYMGSIEEPLRMDVSLDDIPELLANAEQFVKDHRYYRFSIW